MVYNEKQHILYVIDYLQWIVWLKQLHDVIQTVIGKWLKSNWKVALLPLPLPPIPLLLFLLLLLLLVRVILTSLLTLSRVESSLLFTLYVVLFVPRAIARSWCFAVIRQPVFPSISLYSARLKKTQRNKSYIRIITKSNRHHEKSIDTEKYNTDN